MKSIMTIFAQKLMLNLVYSKHDEEDWSRIVAASLETLGFYTSALSSCRLISNTDIMQQIIKNGV